jgi:CheY-like chemotaxis protein
MEMMKGTVLVVDDEPTVRQLVRRILSHNYTVVEAENGVEAVDAARNLKPDLILMDMMMPQMDGLSACYAIKQDESIRHIPVVMLTAITHELNQRLSQSVMGASGYVTKPFSPDELLTMVNDLLPVRKDAPDPAA